MSAKIVFNTYPSAFLNKGGGEYQLINSKKALEKNGCVINLFSQWAPNPPDFIIFHQFSIEPYYSYDICMYYKKLGIKIAVSPILWPTKESLEDLHTRHKIHKILTLADIIFTNSDIESDQIAHHFIVPRDKFHKTRNAITEEDTLPGRKDLFLNEYSIKAPFVIVIANIDKRKNLLNAAQACSELGKPLVIIGHINDQDYFDKIMSLYKETVIYLGPIENIEMKKSALINSEIFLLPSQCETPSIAAIEALTQGTKVVITRVGSTKEYFGEHVTYVNPNNVNSIKQGILKELKTERDMKYINKEMIKEYSWSKTAIEIMNGYSKILGDN